MKQTQEEKLMNKLERIIKDIKLPIEVRLAANKEYWDLVVKVLTEPMHRSERLTGDDYATHINY